MRYQRKILKIKSRFYYYTLVIIGSASIIFLTRCAGNQFEEKYKKLRDSISQARFKADSTQTADSILRGIKEKERADSIIKAEIEKNTRDSINSLKKPKKLKPVKPSNPFIPPQQPAVDYGVLPDHPIPMYGVPVNKN